MKKNPKENTKIALAAIFVVFSVVMSVVMIIKANERLVEGSRRSQKEIQCLTTALWHEARGEPIKGIYAVSNVIANRVLDRKAKGLPSDYCSVIQEKGQFSFITAKKALAVIQRDNLGLLEAEIHDKLLDIATKQYSGELVQVIPKETLWYTHKEIRQDWLRKKQRVVTIGSHTFYK